ncbi:hypothetical protein FA13DRAFT_168653 [Coprinellus micaceus]|uniref:Uncharacterized protein n=1 Tax=Coprinellus micaceus TaxID=71717 RepID=A0A4Y7SGV1_COPMI|nr:hypothetical protein FA13DRAFT_168653 [Coprinellus micaceus]
MKNVSAKVNAFSRRCVERLAGVFSSRLLEWTKFYRLVDDEDPTKIDVSIPLHLVFITCQMGRLDRRFSRALRGVAFPRHVVETALKCWGLPASTSSGESRSSFATELPSRIFVSSRHQAYHALRTLPDLLEAGVLETIVSDLQVPIEGEGVYKWDVAKGLTALYS